MCDAIPIAHPQIAQCKNSFSLAMRKPLSLLWLHRKTPQQLLWKFCDVGLRKMGMYLISSYAKCLRFGLSLRFGLRCECPRRQIASDSGQAMQTIGLAICAAKYRLLLPRSWDNVYRGILWWSFRVAVKGFPVGLIYKRPSNDVWARSLASATQFKRFFTGMWGLIVKAPDASSYW